MPEIDDAKVARITQWLGTGSINLFGSPFAGKDTQGRQLAKLFDAQLIGGGDILRSDSMPKHIKALMHTGELIPQDDYLKIVLPFLSQPTFHTKPLILSSVGRWHGEEPSVLAATEASGHPIKVVVFLKLSDKTMQQRWQTTHQNNDRGKRHDDSASALTVRLKEYRDKTLPVIDFYRQRGLLLEVDGNNDPAKVILEIIDRLYELANQ